MELSNHGERIICGIAHMTKTTRKQRQQELYKVTVEYKQLAIITPSVQCCSAWPRPLERAVSLSGSRKFWLFISRLP